jgi:16S rRNA (cytosine1402-N4)-methyltransferase
MSNNETNTSSNESNYHVPVLLSEVIEGLQIKEDGVYVDCTFGGGGHSSAILQKLNASGKLLGFDQGADAKQNVPNDERVIFIPQNFRHIQRFLKLHQISHVDGLLADLGVSSHQFDEAARGFSIRFDAALDMRMDTRNTTTAAYLVNNFTALQLHKMFEQYGEVTNAKTLANVIVQQRLIAPINTINQFKNAVKDVVKGNPQKYFAQVFQAFRIQVNQELVVLEELLLQIPSILKPNGRAVIITFHSLEDRIVKSFFKHGTIGEPETDDLYGNKNPNPLKTITKKPITASDQELKLNSRSRSAKLRIAEKK